MVGAVVSSWSERDDVTRGADYDARWTEMAEAGESIHGEADLVCHLLASAPAPPERPSVLDAGCGTGRVAIELARRGLDVMGVDLDPAMLDTARAKAPDLPWHLGDLARVDLGRRFDLVAMAGNVMIFVAPGTEGDVVANLTHHLVAGGLLVAGFQLGDARLPLADYDAHAEHALSLIHI